MSDQEFIQPPANTDVKAWLQQRREEMQGKKRTQFHRTLVDQVGNVGKVRRAHVSISTNN